MNKKRVILPLVAVIVLLITSGYTRRLYEVTKQIEIFTGLYKKLHESYVDETNPAELMEAAIDAMLGQLDPYTKFWNEQDVEAAKIRNAGEYTGIGAVVKTIDDRILIIEPYKDYPADRAGLKAGDEIIKIGNTELKDYKNDAGELLKGAPGSQVALTYKRQGKVNTTQLTRREIEVKAVPYYTLLNDKTGYIVLSKFNRKAAAETTNAFKDLKSKGATKMILDLRNNPGGLMDQAISIANIFLPKDRLITKTKSAVKEYSKEYRTRDDALDTNIPLVVLVNGRSASASEIVAGAIQDWDRGVVIGARSFGKGLVQRPMPLKYNTKLKITISRYYTPSGRCIQALDYWNRDKENRPVRIQEKDYKAYKTLLNNRLVYDGGGILPDVELETTKTSSITKALLNDNAIFDYSVDYYYKHPGMNTSNDFSFTDRDYQDFTNFIKNSSFNYETKTEESLDEVLRIAKNEEFSDDIKNSLNGVTLAIERAKDKELQDKRPEIEALLTDEIIKRYSYREGLFQYYIANNPEIKKGQDILSNLSQYNRILNYK